MSEDNRQRMQNKESASELPPPTAIIPQCPNNMLSREPPGHSCPMTRCVHATSATAVAVRISIS